MDRLQAKALVSVQVALRMRYVKPMHSIADLIINVHQRPLSLPLLNTIFTSIRCQVILLVTL